MSRVEVRESSVPGRGRGVFVLETAHVGDALLEFRVGREITRDAPPRPERGEEPDHCTWIDGRVYWIPAPEHFLNHSCDPNAYKRWIGNRIDIVARRELAAGEEVTLDYLINNPGGNSWACDCRADRCRGKTGKSFFDLPESFRREYEPLLAPWFQARFAERLAAFRGRGLR